MQRAKVRFGIPEHRFTSMRLEVLRAYLHAKGPISAYGLAKVLGLQPRSGVMGIYRTLHFLQSIGAIHRIELLDSYVMCRHWQHAHTPIMLLCTICGDVEEFVSHASIKMFDASMRRVGFRRRESTIELRGVCADCG